MSNLSEEEIIKDIIEILELSKEEIESNNENITATLDLQDLKSLKNLYDLYQAEKEKNKELEKDKKALVNNYDNVLRNFISKDKIREEIKEAEGYLDNAKKNSTVKEYELVIEFLEELLEE